MSRLPDVPADPLDALKGIRVLSIVSPHSTTFENIYTENGRVQYLREQAVRLDFASVPEVWRRASIMHMGPIANELDSVLPKDLSPALLGITPQGWMRQRAEDGRVSRSEWENAEPVLQKASAVVMSRQDVNGDDELIEHMAPQTRILVVTEAHAGCVLYWNGDRRRFRAPEVREVDATGAGDVFAAAFFIRLYRPLRIKPKDGLTGQVAGRPWRIGFSFLWATGARTCLRH